MDVIHDDEECRPPDGGSVVTIGAFDGVHLGHRTVIAEVVDRARSEGRRAALVTFDRHPAQVVRPDSAPLLLCDLDHKLELLAGTGLDTVVVVHFDEVAAREEPEDFVRRVLVDCLAVDHVVVGEDFHFGHRRRGHVDLLSELGREWGFTVAGHRLVGRDGAPARDDAQVSSTAIRRALAEGRLDDANRMLGRPHELRGPVVAGDRRGRTIGFPTANVAVAAELLVPADGIYAGEVVRADGTVLPAAVYIGHRPTFYDETAAVLVEAHVLDFDGDLYGERVAVRLVHRIRGDHTFDSVEELAAQLAADCDEARRLLGTHGS